MLDMPEASQIKHEHHTMLEEMVDKPFNEIEGFKQEGWISPMNKTSPIHMNIEHAGMFQTG